MVKILEVCEQFGRTKVGQSPHQVILVVTYRRDEKDWHHKSAWGQNFVRVNSYQTGLGEECEVRRYDMRRHLVLLTFNFLASNQEAEENEALMKMNQKRSVFVRATHVPQ